MRATETLLAPFPVAGSATQVHYGLDPKDLLVVIFAVHHRERETTAVRSSEGGLEWTADAWIITDQPKYSLNLVKELPSQAGRTFFVEADGFGILGQRLRMESDYHPNVVRIVVRASSSGILPRRSRALRVSPS